MKYLGNIRKFALYPSERRVKKTRIDEINRKLLQIDSFLIKRNKSNFFTFYESAKQNFIFNNNIFIGFGN